MKGSGNESMQACTSVYYRKKDVLYVIIMEFHHIKHVL